MPYSLAKAQEARETRRRQEDFKVQELSSYYGTMKAQEAGHRVMEKDDVVRRRREQYERSKEYEMLDTMYKAHQEREIAEQIALDATRVTAAMEGREKATQRKNREIQQLLEGSEELRDLQVKIRTAQMNKERTLQLKERKMLDEQERDYEEKFDAYMDSELARANELQAGEDRARIEAQLQQKAVLEEQILEKQEAQRKAQEEFLKEKDLVDAVVRRIEEEDYAEMVDKREKQQKAKKFIEDFSDEQERLRMERREADRDEERRIEEYAAYKRRIEQEEEDRKNAKQAEADRKYHKLKLEMEAELARQEEEERLINVLMEEEQAAKAAAAAQAKRDREERMKLEMMAANEQMKALRAQRAEEERAEEDRFRQMMLAKFAEDERIEQMNAQRRRMKMQEHKRAVEALIDEKRRMFEEFRAMDLEASRAVEAEDARRAAIVEEQRQRLLREAAEMGLADFLPKGVIREKDDLGVFGIGGSSSGR